METTSVDIINLIKATSSVITPLILFVFGLILTRKIESIKNKSSKEKDWNLKWGETFFDTFQDLNGLVENILSLLFELSEMNKQGKANNPAGLKKQEEIPILLHELSKMEFKLRTQLVFAPEHGKAVNLATSQLFNLIRSIVSNQGGSLDDAHNSLKELNEKAMIAHQEILVIR